jgi:hypothetical protein
MANQMPHSLTSIVVSAAKRLGAVFVRSKNEIFNSGAIVYEIKDDCLYIRKPFLDEENTTCSTMLSSGWYRSQLNEDIPFGEYEMEEDSTEDVKIFYLVK